MNDFEEYIQAGEPGRRERAELVTRFPAFVDSL